MPVKPTRESIEAEMGENEKDRVVRKLHDLAQEAVAWEKHLQQLEAESKLPTFYRSKPHMERMTALGMSQETIDRVQMLLDSLPKIIFGQQR